MVSVSELAPIVDAIDVYRRAAAVTSTSRVLLPTVLTSCE